MSSNNWYKRYPRDFIVGTIGMTLEQKGAYGIIIDLIHDRGGSILDDPKYISRVLGCSLKKWRLIRENLIEAGKISIEEGRIKPATRTLGATI